MPIELQLWVPGSCLLRCRYRLAAVEFCLQRAGLEEEPDASGSQQQRKEHPLPSSPTTAPSSSAYPFSGLYCCIVSLREAETLFRAISDSQAGACMRRAQGAAAGAEAPPLQLGLQTVEGSWLSAPLLPAGATSPPALQADGGDDEQKSSSGTAAATTAAAAVAAGAGAEVVSADELVALLQCARFFNNAMQFGEEEQIALLRCLQGTACSERRAGFEEVIGCRKRDASAWEGKGVAAAFRYADAAHLSHIRDLSCRVRAALLATGKSVAEAFAAFDEDNTSWLSAEEFARALASLPGLALSAADVAELLVHADQDRDGFLDFRDALFPASGFQVRLPSYLSTTYSVVKYGPPSTGDHRMFGRWAGIVTPTVQHTCWLALPSTTVPHPPTPAHTRPFLTPRYDRVCNFG